MSIPLDIDVSLPRVNELLGNLPVFSEINKVSSLISETGLEFQSTTPEAMILGRSLGENVNGFQSLTSNRDLDTIPSLGGFGIGANIGGIRVTAQVPGFSSALTQVQSAPVSIAALTGRDVGSTAENNEILLCNSAESIKTGLARVTGITASYSSVINACIQPQFRPAASSAFSKILTSTSISNPLSSIANQVSNLVGGLNLSVKASIGDVSISFGIMDNVSLSIDNYIERQVRDVTNADIPPEAIADAVRSISSGYPRDAVSAIQDYSTVDFPSLEGAIHSVPTVPSALIGNVDRTAPSDNNTQAPYVIGTGSSEWAGKNTDLNTYVFQPVRSQEELIAEFRQIRREVTEFVLHWTANYTDQGHIGAREVHQVAINRTDFDFDGCSYHYIVKRNGIIERGRPVGIQGAHTLRGHNRYSIGISFVAGYNCASGTPSPNRYVSADSITTEQFQAFDHWARAFYQVYPAGQAFGHNDTDPGRKPDPGFDVPEYCRTKFGKQNIIGAAQGPLSPSALAATV